MNKSHSQYITKMKKVFSENKVLLLLVIAMIVVCFISVILFSLQSFIPSLDIGASDKIGAAIGGITTPVIGIFSSIIVYKAFELQNKTYKQQIARDESNRLYAMINDLDNEVNSFYTSKKESGNYITLKGKEGLNHYANGTLSGHGGGDDICFIKFFENKQLIKLCRSFKHVKESISKSPISEEDKKFFNEKLNDYYLTILGHAVRTVIDGYTKSSVRGDQYFTELRQFYSDNPLPENDMYLIPDYEELEGESPIAQA